MSVDLMNFLRVCSINGLLFCSVMIPLSIKIDTTSRKKNPASTNSTLNCPYRFSLTFSSSMLNVSGMLAFCMLITSVGRKEMFNFHCINVF